MPMNSVGTHRVGLARLLPSACALLSLASSEAGRAEVSGTCVAPPADLVSWWAAENDATDETGANPGNASAAGFAIGQVGTAFDFDGDNDSVSVPHSASLSPQQFTIEGWIETASLPGPFVGFIAQQSGSTDVFGYELGVNVPSGQLRLTLNGAIGGGDLQNFGPDLRDGVFHHVAGTYDGLRMHTWVDGVRVGTLVENEAVSYEAGAPFVIGRRPALTIDGDWNGRIDELSFYSRALCAAEIRAIFLAGTAGKCDEGPVVACELFEDSFESTNTLAWSAQSP